MRLDFYRRGDALLWDLTEDGYSLIGQGPGLEDHAFGFFVNPTAARAHEGLIDHLPLSREEAVDWMYAAGLIPGDRSDLPARPSGKVMLEVARMHPTSFPARLSMLLSSKGVQGEQIQNLLELVQSSAPSSAVNPLHDPSLDTLLLGRQHVDESPTQMRIAAKIAAAVELPDED